MRKHDLTIYEAFGELSHLSRAVQKVRKDMLNAVDQFGYDQKKKFSDVMNGFEE